MMSGLFYIWHKKAWAILVGGYIFSHKFRLRPRLLKQFIPKNVIKKIFYMTSKLDVKMFLSERRLPYMPLLNSVHNQC